MRKQNPGKLTALLAATLLVACGQSSSGLDVAAHTQDVLEWRADRLESLMDPMGFLRLAGLFWLQPGTYKFGSDAANDVVFPAPAAAFIGEFTVSQLGVHMTVMEGVDVRSDDIPIDSIFMSDDTSGAPITIAHGSLAWIVVKRENRFAVRLRDFEHPAIAAFGELPYYDIDPALRVTAVLKRYAQPRVVQVGTVIEGLGWNPQSPGVVVFEIDGKSYELEAYDSGEELFFIFGDETNRGETYGAGRFLYSNMAGDDGVTVLDFNKSHSPPCAFNDFATCPVASPRNRLPVRIEAGEKVDPALHYAASH